MINRELFRIEPNVGSEAYKTYSLAAPISTHTRPGVCGEVEAACSNAVLETDPCFELHCGPNAHGFAIVADVSTLLGQKQANYIRLKSGRHFTANQAGDLVTFTFPAGQQCFDPHRVSLERDPIFSTVGGDYRGNPMRTPRRIMKPADWVDDFGNHQIGIADARQRG
jgi:hypothetical protein